jgi:hypothetical protein
MLQICNNKKIWFILVAKNLLLYPSCARPHELEWKTWIAIISPSPISSVGVYAMLLRYGVMFWCALESFWKPPAGPQTNLCKAELRASLLAVAHNSDRRRGVEIDFHRRAAKSSSKALSAADYYIRARVCLRAPTVAKWERAKCQMDASERGCLMMRRCLFGHCCEFSIKIACALLAAMATPLNALCAARRIQR